MFLGRGKSSGPGPSMGRSSGPGIMDSLLKRDLLILGKQAISGPGMGRGRSFATETPG